MCRSARAALRQATSVPHERLHQAPPFVAIASEQLEIDGYIDLLTRMAAFYFSVGKALDPDDARWELLAQDLEYLGSAGPMSLSWQRPASHLDRLGWHYVVDGSSLGGKVIYSQLDYLFEASFKGRSFFRGSASDRVKWQALCDQLELHGSDQDAVDEMIEGANQAFGMFGRLIAEAGTDD